MICQKGSIFDDFFFFFFFFFFWLCWQAIDGPYIECGLGSFVNFSGDPDQYC